MNIINPATEEIIAQVAEDTPQSVQEKYNVLRKGQKQWKHIPLDERVDCIRRFVTHLEQNKSSLAQTLTSEMGKPLVQAVNEINGAIRRINFFTENAKKWLHEEWMIEEGAVQEKIGFEPLGVIGNISAWNYPYLVGVNVFIPALIAGNAVLYKPSEYTTLTGLEIEKLLLHSGIPADVFKAVIGGKEAGQALLDLPLDGYFFTGSYKTGRYIAEKVAPKLVPCQLELGGKDALYVMDDIENIDQVAAAAVDGAFYNNGQSCCAVERVYVHERIYDRFVDEFIKELQKLKTGHPTEDGVYMSAVTRREQLNLLEAQVNDAVQKGAKLVCGGKRAEGKGYFFQPTILTDVNHTMQIMKDESFGPVIGIQKVKDDREALELMEDTEYGLTGAVYSKSRERAEQLLNQLDTGSVYWNCCDRVSPHLPWSGRRHSGLGATLSYLGIRAFVRPKGYHLNTAFKI